MTLDTTLAKYTYTCTGFTTQPRFIINNHLGDQLGFDFNSENIFEGGSLRSKNVLNFVSTNTLFLHSDIIESQNNILQEFYADNTVPYSFLTYQCLSQELYSKRLRTRENKAFHFSLSDEHGNEVNLNGHQLSFSLMLYKKESLTDMFRAYMEIISTKQT